MDKHAQHSKWLNKQVLLRSLLNNWFFSAMAFSVDTHIRYVAVDGMGGDFSPHAVIEGVLDAARSGVPILLCGPEKKLTRYLSEHCAEWETLGIVVLQAGQEIGTQAHD